jgi:hypothetical protein
MSVVKKIKQVTSGAAISFTATVVAGTISGSQIAPLGILAASLFGGAAQATQVTSSDKVRRIETSTIRRINQKDE